MHELTLRVGTAVNFRQGAELGVGAEDEIDACAGPFHLAGLAIAAFEEVGGFRDRLPFCAHVEQV